MQYRIYQELHVFERVRTRINGEDTCEVVDAVKKQIPTEVYFNTEKEAHDYCQEFYDKHVEDIVCGEGYAYVKLNYLLIQDY